MQNLKFHTGNIMKKLLKILGSIKLAFITIALLTLFFIFSTFIPQIDAGLQQPEGANSLFFSIIFSFLGLDHFFSSPVFYFLFGIFIINLSACTLNRILTQIKKKKNRRIGPDILHIGLLFLCAGGLISSLYRENYFVWLYTNDRVETPNGFILTLNDYSEEVYTDGRIKEYKSVITLEKDGKIIKDKYPLTVNNPLKINDYDLFQTSSRNNTVLILSRKKEDITLVPGNKFLLNNIEFIC